MIAVKLSDTEIRICRGIGKLRNEETAKHVPEMMQDKTKDPVQISIDGVITEYAVSKFLNLNFDLNCDYRQFGADLVSHSGRLIDVKSTDKVGGNLNAVAKSNAKPCDLFVLTEIHHAHVAIVGWIPRQRFLIDANLRDIGNGPFYSVTQQMLYPFYELSDKEALW